MPSVPVPLQAADDDRPTLAALGVLAFAVANMGHEALGHGLATLAVGGTPVLLTTCYLRTSGPYNKWVPAAGGLMNVAIGLAAVAALAVERLSSRFSSRLRYFLVLVAAFNLFFAFGYPAYSGIALFGDWAAVIAGFEPPWLWRLLLVVVSVTGYAAGMRLLARPLAPFTATAGQPAKSRFLRITLTPYIAAMILACLAGAQNPNGWRTMLTSGLPAAAAAFGLTQIDQLPAARPGSNTIFAAPIERSTPWILAAASVLVLFVGVLGPGMHLH